MDKLGKVQYVTQKQKKVLLDYETVAEGGWWGQAGIDALSLVVLQPGEQPGTTLWGCFKPDYPRYRTLVKAQKKVKSNTVNTKILQEVKEFLFSPK